MAAVSQYWVDRYVRVFHTLPIRHISSRWLRAGRSCNYKPCALKTARPQARPRKGNAMKSIVLAITRHANTATAAVSRIDSTVGSIVSSQRS
jgi:hypothetical protein